LCSECKTGKWHGVFRKKYYPKGEFKTNRLGELEHIATGSTYLGSFEITDKSGDSNGNEESI
jgi:hypothetical protein